MSKLNYNKKDKPVIYGLKIKNQYHYIGKTIKENKNGDILPSYLSHLSRIKTLNDLKYDNDIEIVNIKTLENNEWFDDKLSEVVKKYNENHPLKNAKYLCEGKRSVWEGTGGYWKDKKRDKHTLKRLEESKFIQICQYDKEGNLINIWNSIKEPAILIFKDYKVVNGSACSRLYGVLKNNSLKGKFAKNSYWYYVIDLYEEYNTIPKKLNFIEIRNKEKEKKSLANQKRNRDYHELLYTESKIYTVELLDDNNNVINTFDNVKHAHHMLGISLSTVKNICRGNIKRPKFNLRYGKKIKQKMLKDIQY